MTIRVGTATQIERNPRDLPDTYPIEVYVMDKAGSPGTYVLGTGDKDDEATAFMSNTGGDVYVLDSDPAEEDRKLYAVTATTVVF